MPPLTIIFPLLRNPIIGTPRVFAPRILFLLRKEQLVCSKKALKQVIKRIDYLRHISAITGRFKIDYQQQGPHRDCPPQHKARCREFPLPQPEGTRDGYRRTRRKQSLSFAPVAPVRLWRGHPAGGKNKKGSALD